MTAVVQCVVSIGVSDDKYGCHYGNVILKCEICCALLGLVCRVFQSVPALYIWHSRYLYFHCGML